MKVTWESVKNSVSSRNVKRSDIPFNPLISLCEITDLVVLIDDLYFPGQQSELFERLQRRTGKELADIYVQLDNKRRHSESSHARDCAHLAIDNLRCAIIARKRRAIITKTRIDLLFVEEIDFYHQAVLDGGASSFGKFLVAIFKEYDERPPVNPQEAPIYRFIYNETFSEHVHRGSLNLAILEDMGHQQNSYFWSNANLFEVKTNGSTTVTIYEKHKKDKTLSLERDYPMRPRLEPGMLPPITLNQIIRTAIEVERRMIELNPEELNIIKSNIGSLIKTYKIGGLSFQTEPGLYTLITDKLGVFLEKHRFMSYTAFGIKHLIWTMPNVALTILRDFLEYLTRRKDTGIILALSSGGTLLLGGTELVKRRFGRPALAFGAAAAFTEIAFILITATSNDNNPLKKFRAILLEEISKDAEHFHYLIVKMDKAKLRNWQKNFIFCWASLVGLSVFVLAKPWLSELLFSVTGKKDDSQIIDIASTVLAAFEGVATTMGAYLGTVTFWEDTRIRWLNPSLIDPKKSCLSKSAFGTVYLFYLLITLVGTVPVFAAPFKQQFTARFGDEISKHAAGWALGGLASLTLVGQPANPSYKIFLDIKTHHIIPKKWQEAVRFLVYMTVTGVYVASIFGLSEASLHDEFSDSPDAEYLRKFFSSCVAVSMTFAAYEAISDVSSSICKAVTQGPSCVYKAVTQCSSSVYKVATQGSSNVYKAATQCWGSFFKAGPNEFSPLLIQDDDSGSYLTIDTVAQIPTLHNQQPSGPPEPSLEVNCSRQLNDENGEVYTDASDYIIIEPEEIFVDASTFQI